MSVEHIVVYKGRNSPHTIIAMKDGVAIDFVSQGVDRLGIVLDGLEYSSEGGFVEFTAQGEVTFKLGTIENPPKRKSIGRLIIYSDAYPLGLPLFTERTDYKLIFEFI